MSARTRLVLTLILFSVVLWREPDAIAPLIMFVPFDVAFMLSRGGFHVADAAALISAGSIVLGVIAIAQNKRWTTDLFARFGLVVGAVLFVVSSRPSGLSAISALPFAVVVFWPLKRKPNQTPEPTALIVTPPAAQEPRQ